MNRGAGLAGIDTEAMRLAFPSRLRIQLRSGRSFDIDGEDRGACGHPLEEQREVVDRKAALVGPEPVVVTVSPPLEPVAETEPVAVAEDPAEGQRWLPGADERGR
jgi:hypothetical protein